MINLRIAEISSRKVWDGFITSFEHANILQSWSWGQFQKTYGRKVWYLGVFNNNELVGVALAQLIPTRLRTHIYVSNGPVVLEEYKETAYEKLLGYLKAIGIKEKAKFIRIDPLLLDNEQNNRFMKLLKLTKANTHVQAERKWILDISKDEDTLLSEMDKNTRYEIKKSKKEGVETFSSTDLKDYKKFEIVFKETVKRQKFIPHSLNYYKTQFEVMSKLGNYKIIWAEKDNTVISGALVGYYGDSAFYLHAGSINNKETNKLMGPQAVVWRAIQEAKKLNMKYFDFWGIAPTDNPKDKWAGFTKFKKGFGGFEQRLIRAHDLPLSPQYYAISILEKFREVWGLPYFYLSKLKKQND